MPPTTSILADSENFVANYFDVVHDKVLVLVGIVIPPNVQRDEFSLPGENLFDAFVVPFSGQSRLPDSNVLHQYFSLLGEKVLDALVAQSLLFVHCWLCSSSSSVIVVRYRPLVPVLSRTSLPISRLRT